jgi:predicted Zn-dependent protease
VLGHEIGHITGGHVEERMSQALLAQGVLLGVGSATESQLAVLGAQLFASGYLLKFSRDQESESDRLGLGYMVRAGYDPTGMLQVLEVLAAAAEGASPPEILSTHPDPQRRIAEVRALLDSTYREHRGNPGYQLGEDRYRGELLPALRGSAQPRGRRRPTRPAVARRPRRRTRNHPGVTCNTISSSARSSIGPASPHSATPSPRSGRR